ncbi:MAG: isorenieratene synthase, partial [Myxococcales bacterium]|nr:isorenieratene synthase [Myxococcales bacterium]
FAIWRLWLDGPLTPERAPFAGTTGVGLLDNISIYDAIQDESAAWASQQSGSVVELHAYAVPPDSDEAMLRAELWEGAVALYPELALRTVVDDRFLLRQDCPAFNPGSHRNRPGVRTPDSTVTLAGDFVRLDIPSALMERATASGFSAANAHLERWGVAGEPIQSVPTHGLLAAAPTRSNGLPAARYAV